VLAVLKERPVLIRVRFARNVLGRRAGAVDWVEATPIVDALVDNGSLRWMDSPGETLFSRDLMKTIGMDVESPGNDDESPGDESP
jgi:hypothetical protein